MNSHNVLGCEAISSKAVLVLKNFLDLRLDTVKKQNITNLSSFISTRYASVVLSDPEVIFLGEEKNANFIKFSIVVCL